jgi:hypothetical protein
VPAQCVEALRALTHGAIPGSEHDAVRLWLFGLDRNETYARPLRRFADGLGIRCVALRRRPVRAAGWGLAGSRPSSDLPGLTPEQEGLLRVIRCLPVTCAPRQASDKP